MKEWTDRLSANSTDVLFLYLELFDVVEKFDLKRLLKIYQLSLNLLSSNEDLETVEAELLTMEIVKAYEKSRLLFCFC